MQIDREDRQQQEKNDGDINQKWRGRAFGRIAPRSRPLPGTAPEWSQQSPQDIQHSDRFSLHRAPSLNRPLADVEIGQKDIVPHLQAGVARHERVGQVVWTLGILKSDRT